MSAEVAHRFVASRKGSHITGVALVALGAFLLISLATYSKFDAPGSSGLVSSMNATAHKTFNWGGKIGAYTAYAAFTAAGFAAFLAPALALLWGWNRLRQRPFRRDVVRSVGLIGLATLWCLGSGLPPFTKYTAFELGGWLGTKTASQILIPYAGRIGAAVVLGALFIASAMLCTEVDPRRVGRAISNAVRGVARMWLRIGGIGPRLHRQVFGFLRNRRQIRAPGRSLPGGDDGRWPRVRHRPEMAQLDPDRSSTDHDFPPVSGPRISPIADRMAGTFDDETQEGEASFAPDSGIEGSHKRVTDHGIVESTSRGRRGVVGSSSYKIPTSSLLDSTPGDDGSHERDILVENARVLEEALNDFDVEGKVVEVSPGPVVTRYEVEPAAGVKVNRIVTLSDDLARVMSAQGIRIQAPVPGKSVVGVEIANRDSDTVYLREIVESSAFRRADCGLPMALGKTITGEPFVADLAKMPHLLVAGATGSGKSVCINSLIASILFKASPEQVRLLMIDPKVVELTMYNDIPHLLVPVVTDPKRASEALKWAVAEMESRYQLLAELGVRNLTDYNAKVEKMEADSDLEEEGDGHKTLPCIVVVIDEFSDLMLTAPADVETSLMSLAQKSRAVGIHIILATQRPSVNVITGVIKANFPSRIAFQVASKTDSRTILDLNGAERLLGKGDMLFLPSGQGEPIRIHGAFISGEETERLVEAIKETNYQAEEVAVFLGRADIHSPPQERDSLFDEAVKVLVEYGQASTSFLQRRMKVGYSRAARLMDELEGAGIVGPAEGAKPREILIETEAGETTAVDEVAHDMAGER